MDFWQFGIYIVILIGASSLVIMTILLLVRRMNQDKHPRSRQKSHNENTEWALAPPVKKSTTSTSSSPNGADQRESGEEVTEPVPAPPQDDLHAVEETLLISPLSAPEIVEVPQTAEHQVANLEPLQTTSAPLIQATSIETEDASQTNDETDATEDDSLSIFRAQDTQENPLSELSVALPDIDVLDLLREGKEVLKILGSETETDTKWGVT